ncbi:MAG: phosphatidylinositol mannoside acyltransferase [Acidimicrobiales bacterium]
MEDRRRRFVYLVYRTLGTAMRVVPEWVAASAAAAVGETLAARRGTAWDQRTRHMHRVLASTSPAVPPDPAVVRRWTRRAFRAYARYWLEGARLPGTGIAQVNQRMMVERGYEHLKAAMAARNGVVMVLPHVGSWEWGGAFLASEGYPMTSVAERIEPPALFEWFVKERQAMGLTIVPLGSDSGAVVLKTLRSGGLVGLLCDRDIVGDGVAVEFFGEGTTFPAGPATLALRTGAVLVAAVVYSGPGRDHMAVITPPLDTSRSGSFRTDVSRITQEIAHVFEQFIVRSPEQWHLYQPNWPSDRATGPGD